MKYLQMNAANGFTRIMASLLIFIDHAKNAAGCLVAMGMMHVSNKHLILDTLVVGMG
jgi:hypothetical protein